MPPPGPAEAPRFFAPLESLRGLAALLVVFYHAAWLNPVTASNFIQNGALMVDFFFVLSGFVIFHSYGYKLGSPRAALRFLWLRLGRLYPLHLAFLLVFLGFELAKYLAERHFGIVADKPAFTVNGGYSFITNLLLVHSLGLHDSLTYNYPSWSISTEFYAYVVFVAVRSLFGNDGLFTTAAILIVVGCAWLLLRVNMIPLTAAGFDWGFFRCCGGFFLGTLVYRLYAYLLMRRSRAGYRPMSRITAWFAPASLAAMVLCLCLIDPDGRLTYLLPLLSAGVILAIVAWPQGGLQNLLSTTPFTWLGRVSYSVYMVHAALVWIFTQILTVVLKYPKIELADGGHGVGTAPAVGLMVLAIYTVGVLVLSNFTYRWIEEPFRERSRRAAQRWFPTSGGAPRRAGQTPRGGGGLGSDTAQA